ncbi:MAG: type II toxin-antitoxin system VapC family toxin [Polyangia bacterium]
MARVFLDANVFLYAVGGEGLQRQPCRDLLQAVGDGEIEAVTNAEVLQEILHVRSRRVNIKDAVVAVRAVSELVREVLPVRREDVLEACRLLERHPGLGARDAVHVAVMQNGSVHLLVSVDGDFDVLKEIRRLSPKDALGLAR